MTAKIDLKLARSHISDTGLLANFMGKAQRWALWEGLKGEESAHFVELIQATVERIVGMPKTYETDGQGMNAKVHLHYFLGGFDAWISEKDMGSGDPDDTQQNQAFGLARMGGGDGDLGYISIQELIQNGVELDLYWDAAKTLKDIK